MATLDLEILCDEILGDGRGCADGGDEATARISNPLAENGCEQEPGPLTWLNSARVTADSEEDAVHCVVSVGDPRGGFCFTVRRLSSGALVIHVPHPGESLPHCATKALHPGTLEVVGDFSDPEPSWVDAVSRMPAAACVNRLLALGYAVDEADDVAELREAVVQAVQDGDIEPSEVE